MRVLNENGIEKAIDYLGSGEWTILTDSNGPAVGGLTSEAISELGKIGVIAERIGNMHRLLVEEAPAEPPVQTVNDDNIINAADQEAAKEGFDINNDNHIKALAQKLIPHLSATLPTKEEVNAALNQLKSMTVENDEFVKNLATFLKNVKKDSRP